MPSIQEYENLKSQKAQKQREYNNTKERIRERDGKIERLKRTKRILSDQKSAFNEIKKDDKKTVDEKKNSSFSGQNFSLFRSKGSLMVDENDNFYKYSLDAALDAVNNEITRLENENNNEYGLLGRLASAINSLANAIENFFN